MPRKQDTATINMEKHQKYTLNDYVRILHRKFLLENSGTRG
ncbi:hypothetical protein NP493_241g00021 [Ridgeia piscesae]|uniref:Uncharacterized protein n=1 Tax=Ridgeia piscesae TaxID=27915 RepID=A0AAD9NZB1_RIDPI|nr:hypothetical protein NP493_241g00021 [Ridgeia piscesae]